MRFRERLLRWASAKCSAWSYDWCDLSNKFSGWADGPPKPWVAQGPIDQSLHDALVEHYRHSSPPVFLLDKIDKAKRFEDVGLFRYGYESKIVFANYHDTFDELRETSGG